MTRRTIIPATLLAVLMPVALTACGGGGSGSADTTGAATTPPAASTTAVATTAPDTQATAATTAAAPSTTRPRNRQRAGDVIAVFPSGGSVDGVVAVEGSPLFAGSTVAADGGGQLDFRVGKKLPSCRARVGGSARVAPSGEVLLEFLAGDVTCGSAPGGGNVNVLVAGAVVRFSDPVFRVQYDEGGRPELQVVQGFVQVAYEGQRVLAGPNQRVGLTSGQGPDIGPWSVDELGPEGPKTARTAADWALGNTMPKLPRLVYPKPNPARSPTLQQAGGVLRIGVVLPEGSGDDRPLQMTQNVAGTLFGPRWGMEVDVQQVSQADAVAGLESGQLALVVIGATPKGATPFFQDDSGQTWTIVTPPGDAELAKAVQGTVRTSLQASCSFNGSGVSGYAAPNPTCYEGIYKDTYGAAFVPFEVFAPLLG